MRLKFSFDGTIITESTSKHYKTLLNVFIETLKANKYHLPLTW